MRASGVISNRKPESQDTPTARIVEGELNMGSQIRLRAAILATADLTG
jgi:hypothetical protein